MALGSSVRRESSPDELAISDVKNDLTWKEVDSILNRLTNRLRAAIRGDEKRIAVMARNSHQLLLTQAAALRAGVSFTPINPAWTPDEAEYVLRDAAASTLFVGPETTDVAHHLAARKAIARVVAWSHPAHGSFESWEEWIQSGSDDEPPAALKPRLPLLYTSGTTGRPKGVEMVVRTRKTLGAGETVAELNERLAMTLPGGVRGPYLVIGPLHHGGPLVALRYLAAGEPVIVLRRFDPEETLRVIDRYRVRATMVVPTHLSRMLELPAEVRDAYQTDSLRFVYHSGAPMSVELKRSAIGWLGPILVDSYGGAEVGTLCSITSEEWLRRPGSVGRPIAGIEVRVDEAVEIGSKGDESGLLFFRDARGHRVIYRNAPEKTARANRDDGFFTIGDIGRVDDDGYVFITDRVADVIVSGGVNLYPAEVELVLAAHPQVSDSACIGVPNNDLGEELIALIELADQANQPSSDELEQFCRARLAGYKVPKRFEIVESIERDPLGKVDRRRLRAPYWPAERAIGG